MALFWAGIEPPDLSRTSPEPGLSLIEAERHVLARTSDEGGR